MTNHHTPTAPPLGTHPRSRRHPPPDLGETTPRRPSSPARHSPSPLENEVLDLNYSPSPDLPSPEEKEAGSDWQEEVHEAEATVPWKRTQSTITEAEGPNKQQKEEDKRAEERPHQRLKSEIVKTKPPRTYKEAVVGVTGEAYSGRQSKDKPEEWKEVKVKYWWWRSGSITRARGSSSFQDRQEGKKKHGSFEAWFRKETEGRCFNCLAKDHRVAECRDPTRCVRCYRSSHKAVVCKSLKRSQPHTTSHRPQNKPQLGEQQSHYTRKKTREKKERRRVWQR